MVKTDLKDWDEIEECTKILVEKILTKNRQFNSVSTISRGGLVPARLVADRLSIKNIIVDDETVPADSLFIDDIYDTGETFRRIIEKAEDPGNLVFATLYARKGQKYPVQLIYAKLTKGNEYVVYPWDRFEHGYPSVG